jgi:hypothetical protein
MRTVRASAILRERRREVTVEIPAALLTEAADDATAGEAIRVRIRARSDRMLFKAPPSPLPKHIAMAPRAMPFGVGRTDGGPPRTALSFRLTTPSPASTVLAPARRSGPAARSSVVEAEHMGAWSASRRTASCLAWAEMV